MLHLVRSLSQIKTNNKTTVTEIRATTTKMVTVLKAMVKNMVKRHNSMERSKIMEKKVKMAMVRKLTTAQKVRAMDRAKTMEMRLSIEGCEKIRFNLRINNGHSIENVYFVKINTNMFCLYKRIHSFIHSNIK